jgi:copper resistance protein C
MNGTRHRRIRVGARIAAASLVFFVVVGIAQAHAILKESSPVANSTVKGPDVPIRLRYNVRVDATRSKLQLLLPDNSNMELTMEKQSAPDVMSAKATGLKAGAYRIRWQVLAPDGHITRGEIPFTVSGS